MSSLVKFINFIFLHVANYFITSFSRTQQVPILLMLILLLGTITIMVLKKCEAFHFGKQEQIEDIFWHIEELEIAPKKDTEYSGTWMLEFNYVDNTVTGDRCDTLSSDPNHQFFDHITGTFNPKFNTVELEFTWSANKKHYRFTGEYHPFSKHITGDWTATDPDFEHKGTFDSVPTTENECHI